MHIGCLEAEGPDHFYPELRVLAPRSGVLSRSHTCTVLPIMIASNQIGTGTYVSISPESIVFSVFSW